MKNRDIDNVISDLKIKKRELLAQIYPLTLDIEVLGFIRKFGTSGSHDVIEQTVKKYNL